MIVIIMTSDQVRHSVDCGAGTAPFLAVNSATIVVSLSCFISFILSTFFNSQLFATTQLNSNNQVIRGKRACIWGSIYLDAFGEEDRELK